MNKSELSAIANPFEEMAEALHELEKVLSAGLFGAADLSGVRIQRNRLSYPRRDKPVTDTAHIRRCYPVLAYTSGVPP